MLLDKNNKFKQKAIIVLYLWTKRINNDEFFAIVVARLLRKCENKPFFVAIMRGETFAKIIDKHQHLF